MKSLTFSLLAVGLFLAVIAVDAAPAPFPRRGQPDPPPQVTPGNYWLCWDTGGCRYDWTLEQGGTCFTRGNTWVGSWEWCPKSRFLTVHETSDGRTWYCWVVRLGKGLEGTTTPASGWGEVKVKLVRKE